MFRNILVAVDGSKHANRAVECAAKLSAQFDAKLIILHVMAHAGSGRVPEELADFARIEHLQINEAEVLQQVADAIVGRARTLALTSGARDAETALRTGDAASQIIDYCTANNIDTVVLGRRGLSDLAGLFVGSVSHKVAQRSRCVCVTVEDAD